MAFILIQTPETGGAGHALQLVALVRAGATFVNGKLVRRPNERLFGGGCGNCSAPLQAQLINGGYRTFAVVDVPRVDLALHQAKRSSALASQRGPPPILSDMGSADRPASAQPTHRRRRDRGQDLTLELAAPLITGGRPSGAVGLNTGRVGRAA